MYKPEYTATSHFSNEIRQTFFNKTEYVIQFSG
jgi:hypothetical protein